MSHAAPVARLLFSIIKAVSELEWHVADYGFRLLRPGIRLWTSIDQSFELMRGVFDQC
jgi:hypothetical protein